MIFNAFIYTLVSYTQRTVTNSNSTQNSGQSCFVKSFQILLHNMSKYQSRMVLFHTSSNPRVFKDFETDNKQGMNENTRKL